MPHAPLTPVHTDGSADAPAPVVHLTRRARIEAERAAATASSGGAPERVEHATAVAETSRASRAALGDATFDDLVSPGTPATPAAPVSPIDLAPASPAMPAATGVPA
ncbi:hypothetical protein ACEN9R_17070, partial [Curtobacterium sp. CT11-133]